MASMPSGIQELMAAEQRAMAVVKEARDAKVQRMKTAKIEAAAIIEAYRAEKEAAFDARSIEMAVTDDAASMQAGATVDLGGMRAEFDAHKEATIKFMIDHVVSVKG